MMTASRLVVGVVLICLWSAPASAFDVPTGFAVACDDYKLGDNGDGWVCSEKTCDGNKLIGLYCQKDWADGTFSFRRRVDYGYVKPFLSQYLYIAGAWQCVGAADACEKAGTNDSTDQKMLQAPDIPKFWQAAKGKAVDGLKIPSIALVDWSSGEYDYDWPGVLWHSKVWKSLNDLWDFISNESFYAREADLPGGWELGEKKWEWPYQSKQGAGFAGAWVYYKPGSLGLEVQKIDYWAHICDHNVPSTTWEAPQPGQPATDWLLESALTSPHWSQECNWTSYPW